MAKKRLRKLATVTKPSENNESQVPIRTVALVLVITGFVTSFALHPHAFDDFIHSYYEQYNLLVYGNSAHCSESFNYKNLLNTVRENLHGQSQALDQIETLLGRNKSLTAMAIVGRTGVGKTHLLNLLRRHYPWKDNIHHYSWSEYNKHIAGKNRKIEDFTRKLSRCGQNLILIDDLTTKDIDMVLEYQTFLENDNFSIQSSLKLVVIYVFSVLRYTEEFRNEYEKNIERLQNLGNIKTINFIELISSDVRKCIIEIANDLKLKLNGKQIDSVLRTIDVPNVGCKNVNAKIAKYSEFFVQQD